MRAGIKAEWGKLESVIIHTPGIEVIFALLEPNTFLYERHFPLEKGLWEHRGLELKLKELGVKEVYKLKDLVLQELKNNSKQYIESVLSSIHFEGDRREIEVAYQKLEEAIRNEKIDYEQLYHILVLNPTVRLQVGYPEVICKQPLANLMFVRDPQIITDRGLVIGKLSKTQRIRETILTEIAFRALGIEPIYRIKNEGILEGGDYIPMGDFVLIGWKPRTNREGIVQLLNNNCLGFDEVLAVEQPIHPDFPELAEDPQLMMHLDTWFNVASSNVVVANKELLQKAKVTVYGRGSRHQYVFVEETNLHGYIVGRKNFNVFPLKISEQVCYASNFLTIKDGLILAMDVNKNISERYLSLVELPADKYIKLRKAVEREGEEHKGHLFPFNLINLQREYRIEVEYLSLPYLTGGYGGLHCMTCAINRS